MKKYRSHKIVEAGVVAAIEVDEDKTARIAMTDGEVVVSSVGWFHRVCARTDEDELIGGYYVRYADGFDSWSPDGPFEEGYSEHNPD